MRTPAPRSGVDCYGYQGSVEDYFAEVLARNFPGYEIRRDVAMESIRKPDAGASRSGLEKGWNCSCGMHCTGAFCPGCGSRKPKPQLVPMSGGTWTCSCGSVSSGNFCPDCGARKPVSGDWVCACGAKNKSNFCPSCGQPRPSAGVTVNSADPAPASRKRKYLPLTFVLYQNGKPVLAILLCSKRDYGPSVISVNISNLEKACRTQGIRFQRYFREFRNDEAYIRSRISADLR